MKTHTTPCTVEGFFNNEDISSCFSSYHEDLCNSVPVGSIEWLNLYKTINNKICNECINHTVNVNDINNAINKLNLAKTMDFMALHLIISLMHLHCLLSIYNIYLLPCYISILSQNPYVIPL